MFRFTTLTLFGALICACSSSAPDQELLEDGQGSSAVESTLGKVAATFVAGDPSGNMSIAPSTSSCVSVATAAALSVYHFTNCDGPYGLAKINGDVAVSWTSSNPTFHIEVSSSNLRVGNATISSWNASADVTASGAARTMVWQSTASGTIVVHESARAFVRTVDATSTWTVGDSCIDIEGQAQGTIEKSNGTILHVNTRSSAFVACGESCPNSGSELRADDVDDPGVYVQVVYGSSNATYTNDRGQTFTFVPSCEN